MHRDHVPTVPEPLHLLGSTSIAYNQGMVLLEEGKSADAVEPTDVHVFTVQGHPEFTASISDLIISARTSTGVIEKELSEDASKRNKELRNDGVEVIGRLMWKIMGA
jgi:GMP synthase-like glutamine amidotransferase